MARVVNIHEAKTHLSRLVEDVLAGESITIAKAGVPMVDLTIHTQTKRRFGSLSEVLPDIPNAILMETNSEELASHFSSLEEEW
ncbi:MAG: hypothetical protein RL508_533 [Actinomycetota bacterium]|jgi:antitoxin (DNA-binding transcriptional repressor) of toxin-antitoxin stability system